MRIWLCLLLLPLAGCLSLDGSMDDSDDPADTQPSAPYNMTLYVAPGGLTEQPPVGTTMPLRWSINQWLAGLSPPTFRGDGDDHHHRLVLNGTMYFDYHVARATSGGDLRPELTSWFGSGETVIHHVFSDGPDVVQAGDRLQTTETLRLPVGGYVMAAGEEPMLRLGSYYQDGPQVDAIEVVTGANATRVELTVVDIPSMHADEDLDFTEYVELAGGRCVVDANVDGAAEKIWTVPVTPETHQIRVHFDTFTPTDVDISIKGPDGEFVGGTHGPGSHEVADVWWTAIDEAGPGDYTVHMYACTPQRQDVDVHIQTWNRWQ